MRRDVPGEFESTYSGFVYFANISPESKDKIQSIVSGYSIFSGFSKEEDEGYIWINSDKADPDLYLRDRLYLLLDTKIFIRGRIFRISFDNRWWEDFHVECELIIINNGIVEISGGDLSDFLKKNRKIFTENKSLLE